MAPDSLSSTLCCLISGISIAACNAQNNENQVKVMGLNNENQVKMMGFNNLPFADVI
jgi:hypothetical protein